ncbi:hypothetical protein Tco_0720376 [Tanacetum coccineum]
MKRKRIETSKIDLERSKTGGHLQELEQAVKSKNYALMWVVQMEREGIITELKVKKGMRAWKAVTFYREVEHREMEMCEQLMLHINKTQMRTFEKREFVEAMKKL